MFDILRAVGTFLAALAVGLVVQGIAVLNDVDIVQAGAMGTGALLLTGLWICNLGRTPRK